MGRVVTSNLRCNFVSFSFQVSVPEPSVDQRRLLLVTLRRVFLKKNLLLSFYVFCSFLFSECPERFNFLGLPILALGIDFWAQVKISSDNLKMVSSCVSFD